MIKLSILLLSNLFAYNPNSGCPDNSFCQDKVEQKRSSWVKVLKSRRTKRIENFRKKNGIPFGVWSKKPLEEGLSWNSPCANHNTPTETIYQTDLFMKKVKKGKSYIIEKAWRLSPKSKTTMYSIPRGEIPGLISGNSLLFIREDEDQFYGLRVSASGALKVINYPSNPPTPESIECPQKLTKLFQKEYSQVNLYKGSFCKKIWNIKTKKYQTMIFGWACH